MNLMMLPALAVSSLWKCRPFITLSCLILSLISVDLILKYMKVQKQDSLSHIVLFIGMLNKKFTWANKYHYHMSFKQETVDDFHLLVLTRILWIKLFINLLEKVF